MMRTRRLPMLALLAVLFLVAAACGQKEGVHLSSGGGGGGDDLAGDFGPDDGGEGDGGEGDGAGGSGGGAGSGGGSGSGGSGGGSGSGGSGGGRNRGGGGGGNNNNGGGGGDGGPVWGKTIVIGVHAPITGAAPLPSSFRAAAEFYEGYINSRGGIHGRTVQVEVADDEYQPATAVTRCRELVQQKKAFLLVGGGGTDQIQACARAAQQMGVPYLSAGVTEIGMRSLRGYFAVSMSYKQQGPYLANFMRQKFPDLTSDPSKVFMVYSDTPNFRDARDAFTQAFPGAQLKKLSRTPSSTELAQAANDLCAAGAKIAYPLMAPKDWLILIGSQPSTCTIQWSGVGLTMGLNTVTSTGCKSNPRTINGSTFFSPFPGDDVAQGLDPEFKAEVERTDAKPDDIYVALWSVNRAIGELLQRTGPNLTRAAFVRTAETAKNVATGLNPPLSYSPDNHFGADTVHVLQAVCAGNTGGRYNTIDTFAKY